MVACSDFDSEKRKQIPSQRQHCDTISILIEKGADIKGKDEI